MSPSAPRGSHVPIPQIWVFYSTKSRLHAQVSHPELVPASDKDKSPKMGFGGTVLLPDPITAGGLGQAGAHPTGSNTPIPVLQCSEGLGVRFSCISPSDAEEETRRIYPRQRPPPQCAHPPPHTAPSFTDTLKPSRTPTAPSSLPPHPPGPPRELRTPCSFFNQNSFICHKIQSPGGAEGAALA